MPITIWKARAYYASASYIVIDVGPVLRRFLKVRVQLSLRPGVDFP